MKAIAWHTIVKVLGVGYVVETQRYSRVKEGVTGSLSWVPAQSSPMLTEVLSRLDELKVGHIFHVPKSDLSYIVRQITLAQTVALDGAGRRCAGARPELSSEVADPVLAQLLDDMDRDHRRALRHAGEQLGEE